MATHAYTWKIGLEIYSNRQLDTNKPVGENTLLLDLFNGKKYLVQAVYKAGPNDREWAFLPDTVIHTWPAGLLSEPDLKELRARAKYTPNEFCGPYGDIVFFPAGSPAQ
jgi:hypothetical protein